MRAHYEAEATALFEAKLAEFFGAEVVEDATAAMGPHLAAAVTRLADALQARDLAFVEQQGRLTMYFELYRRTTLRGRRWRWRLRAGNHEIVAQGEDYRNRADCEHAIGLVQHSGGAPVRDLGVLPAGIVA